VPEFSEDVARRLAGIDAKLDELLARVEALSRRDPVLATQRFVQSARARLAQALTPQPTVADRYAEVTREIASESQALQAALHGAQAPLPTVVPFPLPPIEPAPSQAPSAVVSLPPGNTIAIDSTTFAGLTQELERMVLKELADRAPTDQQLWAVINHVVGVAELPDAESAAARWKLWQLLRPRVPHPPPAPAG
jgi:hypothetical protein